MQVVNELVSQLFALVQQALAHADSTLPLDVLLRARLVFVAHVHDRGGLTPVDLRAEETVEVLLNLCGDAANSALLARAILTVRVSFLELRGGGGHYLRHIRLLGGALHKLFLHSLLFGLVTAFLRLERWGGFGEVTPQVVQLCAQICGELAVVDGAVKFRH